MEANRGCVEDLLLEDLKHRAERVLDKRARSRHLVHGSLVVKMIKILSNNFVASHRSLDHCPTESCHFPYCRIVKLKIEASDSSIFNSLKTSHITSQLQTNHCNCCGIL